MNIKNIILFVGGLAIGAAGGIIGTRKYLQDKYQKQYEEDHAALEKYYQRVDEYTRREDSPYEEQEEPEEIDQNKTEFNSRPGGRMSSEERAVIREKLNRNWEGTTNYAGMYKIRDDQNDSAEEHPLDQGEDGESNPEAKICKNCTEFVDKDPKNCSGWCEVCEETVGYEDSCSDFKDGVVVSEEEQVFDEHQKSKNKPPKIISVETWQNLPAHIEQDVLYFYAYDEVLCDENEEMIDEPGLLIGDALTKYGFVDSDERTIFVMNYATDTCYEVQKVDASWSDTH